MNSQQGRTTLTISSINLSASFFPRTCTQNPNWAHVFCGASCHLLAPPIERKKKKIFVETEPIWGRGEENATAVVVVSGALIGVVKPPNDAETTQGRRRPMRVQCPPRFSQWSASVSLHTDVGGNLSEGVSCGYGDLDIASSSFLSLSNPAMQTPKGPKS